MRLNQLKDNPGARRAGKRVGRGIGSGTGKTAGRGVKGQKSRSGVAIKGFEGGQMPIHMRLPKRGFNVPRPKRMTAVNIGRIQAAIDAKKLDTKAPITTDVLVEAGVVRRKRDGVRLLGDGKLTAKVTLEVEGASRSAVEAVEKAGGKIILPAREAQSTGTAPQGGKAKEGPEASETA